MTARPVVAPRSRVCHPGAAKRRCRPWARARIWTVTIAAAVCLASGCEHEAAPIEAWQSPEGPTPALSLRAAPLRDPATLPGLWRGLAAVEGDVAAAQLLLTLAGRQDDDALRVDEGARRLVIEAVVRLVQAGQLSERFEALRAVVDRLYRTAPEAPETRFALAYLRWILVADGEGRVERRSVDESVMVDLHSQLAALVRDTPAFDGPPPFDAAWIRRARDAVKAKLGPATAPAAAPAAATPSAEQ